MKQSSLVSKNLIFFVTECKFFIKEVRIPCPSKNRIEREEDSKN